MEKLIKVLPIGLFCAFSLKLIVAGAQLTDCIVLFVLAAYSAYDRFKAVDETIDQLDARFWQQAKEINEKTKQIEELTKQVEDVKSLLSSVKLGQQIRTSQTNRN